jgi:hypothetical protein
MKLKGKTERKLICCIFCKVDHPVSLEKLSTAFSDQKQTIAKEMVDLLKAKKESSD